MDLKYFSTAILTNHEEICIVLNFQVFSIH